MLCHSLVDVADRIRYHDSCLRGCLHVDIIIAHSIVGDNFQVWVCLYDIFINFISQQAEQGISLFHALYQLFFSQHPVCWIDNHFVFFP